MTDRVVSTKLSEEIHTKLLDACNSKGCTPSSFIKDAIMDKINSQQPKEKIKSESRDLTDDSLRKFLGIKPKYIGVKRS